MKQKLFMKYFFGAASIVLLSFTASATILSFVISNYFSKEKYELLENNCSSVANIVSNNMNSIDFKRNIYNIIAIQNRVSGVESFICNKDGIIIVCGCNSRVETGECEHINTIVSKNVLSKADKGSYYGSGKLGGLYNEEYYTVGKTILTSDGDAGGYIFSSTSASSLRQLLTSIFKMYLLSSIFPLIIMFFAFYAMTYKFTKPLRLMSAAAKSMAMGDFSKRIPVTDDDEIGELSVSFNNMTDSLSKVESMRRDFVGNVSHELRTPMTTISGFIDGIIDGTIEEEKRDYYLKIVSDEIKRLSRVVESMLSLAKLEAGEITINPTGFDLTQTIVNVVLSREQLITEKKINVEGLDGLSKCTVTADRDLIYQVVYNLVDNAVKFTENGGIISFGLVQNQNGVQFSVRNTGKGIPKESIDKIFDRFYKIDKSRSLNRTSTGLGLYIVKTIVNIHGGKITAESVENHYTLFTVYLPNIKKNKENK